MISKELKDWLNGSRDYNAGVMLYIKYGSKQTLKSLFAKDKHPDRLLDELRKMYYNEQRNNNPRLIKKAQNLEKKKNVKSNGLSAHLDEQWRGYYKLMAAYHNELTRSKSILKRSNLAGKIKYLENKCISIWAKLDYLAIHGALPQQDAEIEKHTATVDLFLLKREILNLQNSIAYCKRTLAKLNDDLAHGDTDAITKRIKKVQGLWDSRIKELLGKQKLYDETKKARGIK